MYALFWAMLPVRMLLCSGCCSLQVAAISSLSISSLVQGINQDTLFLSVGGMFLSLAGAVISGFLIRSAWVRPGLVREKSLSSCSCRRLGAGLPYESHVTPIGRACIFKKVVLWVFLVEVSSSCSRNLM